MFILIEVIDGSAKVFFFVKLLISINNNLLFSDVVLMANEVKSVLFLVNLDICIC